MTWSTIRLELARNPEFPEGSRYHGYLLHAPLDRHGRLDVTAYEDGRSRAVVEEFWGDRDPKRGRLVHRNRNLWCFSFGENDEEAIFHFGDHTFSPGEYLTVRDLSGADLTFRVTSVVRQAAKADIHH
jgi:hypothetical protein